MARKHRAVIASGHTVLLVDDDRDYLEATRLLLESEGHRVLLAHHGPEALAVLRAESVDVVLLDYFMPGMTGEEVVGRMRDFDSLVQVVLQTGYSDEQPPREMLRRLDIQGYYDKSEGPEKLLLWTDAALKTASTLQRLIEHRQGLDHILEATPELHRVRPLVDLFGVILGQAASLVGAPSSFLAVVEGEEAPAAEGFLAVLRDDSELSISAATGRFDGARVPADLLDPAELACLLETLGAGEIRVTASATIVPLRVGDLTQGVLYLDRPAHGERDVGLLRLFANQATVAIHNAQLYEMAALDPLTGVHARRFLERWLRREVRIAFRAQRPLSLMMLDLDDMKTINDTAGHLVGDQALSAVGKALRQATRENDVVGRYGGDEFLVILPQTDQPGAQRVGDRILEVLAEKNEPGPDGSFPLRCSIGLTVLSPHAFADVGLHRPVPQSYFAEMTQALIRRADEAMYLAKHRGGARLVAHDPLGWAPLGWDR
jgi:diguanylate cyclase (GGDEF)-like protein